MIIAHTLIGKGIPEVAGTSKAHGEGGAKFAEEARKGLGLPDEHYFVSEDVRAYFAEHKKKLCGIRSLGKNVRGLAQKESLTRRKCSTTQSSAKCLTICLSKIPDFPKDAKLATRKAGSEALQPLAQAMPSLISGSADLHGSTLELHQRRRRFHSRRIRRAAISASAFASTACARS